MKAFTLVNNQKGLSLVELIITLALLGVVLAIGYNFFFFGHTSFTLGEAQSIIQSYTRNTALVITKDVRNALDIELASSYQIPSPDEYVIYLNGSTIYKKDEAEDILYQTEPFMSELVFEIAEVNDRFVLIFTITAEKDGKLHNLESQVLLNNIDGDKITQGTLATGESYNAIIYTKP